MVYWVIIGSSYLRPLLMYPAFVSMCAGPPKTLKLAKNRLFWELQQPFLQPVSLGNSGARILHYKSGLTFEHYMMDPGFSRLIADNVTHRVLGLTLFVHPVGTKVSKVFTEVINILLYFLGFSLDTTGSLSPSLGISSIYRNYYWVFIM